MPLPRLKQESEARVAAPSMPSCAFQRRPRWQGRRGKTSGKAAAGEDVEDVGVEPKIGGV